jgi:hypothetical protein
VLTIPRHLATPYVIMSMIQKFTGFLGLGKPNDQPKPENAPIVDKPNVAAVDDVPNQPYGSKAQSDVNSSELVTSEPAAEAKELERARVLWKESLRLLLKQADAKKVVIAGKLRDANSATLVKNPINGYINYAGVIQLGHFYADCYKRLESISTLYDNKRWEEKFANAKTNRDLKSINRELKLIEAAIKKIRVRDFNRSDPSYTQYALNPKSLAVVTEFLRTIPGFIENIQVFVPSNLKTTKDDLAIIVAAISVLKTLKDDVLVNPNAQAKQTVSDFLEELRLYIRLVITKPSDPYLVTRIPEVGITLGKHLRVVENSTALGIFKGTVAGEAPIALDVEIPDPNIKQSKRPVIKKLPEKLAPPSSDTQVAKAGAVSAVAVPLESPSPGPDGGSPAPIKDSNPPPNGREKLTPTQIRETLAKLPEAPKTAIPTKVESPDSAAVITLQAAEASALEVKTLTEALRTQINTINKDVPPRLQTLKVLFKKEYEKVNPKYTKRDRPETDYSHVAKLLDIADKYHKVAQISLISVNELFEQSRKGLAAVKAIQTDLRDVQAVLKENTLDSILNADYAHFNIGEAVIDKLDSDEISKLLSRFTNFVDELLRKENTDPMYIPNQYRALTERITAAIEHGRKRTRVEITDAQKEGILGRVRLILRIMQDALLLIIGASVPHSTSSSELTLATPFFEKCAQAVTRLIDAMYDTGVVSPLPTGTDHQPGALRANSLFSNRITPAASAASAVAVPLATDDAEKTPTGGSTPASLYAELRPEIDSLIAGIRSKQVKIREQFQSILDIAVAMITDDTTTSFADLSGVAVLVNVVSNYHSLASLALRRIFRREASTATTETIEEVKKLMAFTLPLLQRNVLSGALIDPRSDLYTQYKPASTGEDEVSLDEIKRILGHIHQDIANIDSGPYISITKLVNALQEFLDRVVGALTDAYRYISISKDAKLIKEMHEHVRAILYQTRATLMKALGASIPPPGEEKNKGDDVLALLKDLTAENAEIIASIEQVAMRIIAAATDAAGSPASAAAVIPGDALSKRSATPATVVPITAAPISPAGPMDALLDQLISIEAYLYTEYIKWQQQLRDEYKEAMDAYVGSTTPILVYNYVYVSKLAWTTVRYYIFSRQRENVAVYIVAVKRAIRGEAKADIKKINEFLKWADYAMHGTDFNDHPEEYYRKLVPTATDAISKAASALLLILKDISPILTLKRFQEANPGVFELLSDVSEVVQEATNYIALPQHVLTPLGDLLKAMHGSLLKILDMGVTLFGGDDTMDGVAERETRPLIAILKDALLRDMGDTPRPLEDRPRRLADRPPNPALGRQRPPRVLPSRAAVNPPNVYDHEQEEFIQELHKVIPKHYFKNALDLQAEARGLPPPPTLSTAEETMMIVVPTLAVSQRYKRPAPPPRELTQQILIQDADDLRSVMSIAMPGVSPFAQQNAKTPHQRYIEERDAPIVPPALVNRYGYGPVLVSITAANANGRKKAKRRGKTHVTVKLSEEDLANHVTQVTPLEESSDEGGTSGSKFSGTASFLGHRGSRFETKTASSRDSAVDAILFAPTQSQPAANSRRSLSASFDGDNTTAAVADTIVADVDTSAATPFPGTAATTTNHFRPALPALMSSVASAYRARQQQQHAATNSTPGRGTAARPRPVTAPSAPSANAAAVPAATAAAAVGAADIPEDHNNYLREAYDEEKSVAGKSVNKSSTAYTAKYTDRKYPPKSHQIQYTVELPFYHAANSMPASYASAFSERDGGFVINVDNGFAKVLDSDDHGTVNDKNEILLNKDICILGAKVTLTNQTPFSLVAKLKGITGSFHVAKNTTQEKTTGILTTDGSRKAIQSWNKNRKLVQLIEKQLERGKKLQLPSSARPQSSLPRGYIISDCRELYSVLKEFDPEHKLHLPEEVATVGKKKRSPKKFRVGTGNFPAILELARKRHTAKFNNMITSLKQVSLVVRKTEGETTLANFTAPRQRDVQPELMINLTIHYIDAVPSKRGNDSDESGSQEGESSAEESSESGSSEEESEDESESSDGSDDTSSE